MCFENHYKVFVKALQFKPWVGVTLHFIYFYTDSNLNVSFEMLACLCLRVCSCVCVIQKSAPACFLLQSASRQCTIPGTFLHLTVTFSVSPDVPLCKREAVQTKLHVVHLTELHAVLFCFTWRTRIKRSSWAFASCNKSQQVWRLAVCWGPRHSLLSHRLVCSKGPFDADGLFNNAAITMINSLQSS